MTADQIDAGVAGTAHMFQEWVDKDYEVRLMVVADHHDADVFAARIDASTDAAHVDWRADPDALTYSRIEVPDRTRAESVALVRRLGLRYGALDFAVDHDGRWWHFEINPSGQWAWIDPLRQPLTHAITDLLEKGTP